MLRRPTWSADVFVWYPDGRVRRVYLRRRGIFYQASIHPDGTHVVFFGNTSGPPRVWKADLVRGALTALTPAGFGARHPVFSWDGARIAFASDCETGQVPERIEQMKGDGQPRANHLSHLFVMDADGRHVRQITSGPFQDQRPSFSPDGKTLVFVSNRDGAMRLWSVQADGSSAPRLLQSHGWGYRPWFSANGRRSSSSRTSMGGTRSAACRPRAANLRLCPTTTGATATVRSPIQTGRAC